jgi:hypothetical protein
VTATYGGWMLYRNAAPDRPFGTVPQEQQAQDINARGRRNRFGFALLTVGAFFQLLGTLIAGFSH